MPADLGAVLAATSISLAASNSASRSALLLSIAGLIFITLLTKLCGPR